MRGDGFIPFAYAPSIVYTYIGYRRRAMLAEMQGKEQESR